MPITWPNKRKTGGRETKQKRKEGTDAIHELEGKQLRKLMLCVEGQKRSSRR